MAFPPKFFNRGNPLEDLLEDASAFKAMDEAKVVTVTNSAALVFGDIGVDTPAQIGFQYAATNETYLLGVGLSYVGDAGAFTYTAGEGTGDFTTPIPLVAGDIYWTPVLPDTSAAAPYSLTITALSADVGVEKTGTISIVDRFDFSSGDPARVLTTITLSKTAV